MREELKEKTNEKIFDFLVSFLGVSRFLPVLGYFMIQLCGGSALCLPRQESSTIIQGMAVSPLDSYR